MRRSIPIGVEGGGEADEVITHVATAVDVPEFCAVRLEKEASASLMRGIQGKTYRADALYALNVADYKRKVRAGRVEEEQTRTV